MNNEWENEPAYLRFTEDTTGWECIIKRTKALGILCGYVVIPKDSALYNKHYNDELFNNIKVHGGLTFSEYEKDEYLIGFDCAHLDDLAPYNQDLYQGTYRNISYVEYECLRLARQLYELSNTYTKLNTGDNTMTYDEVLNLLTNIHDWCKDRYKDEYATCEDEDNNYELLWEIENVKLMIESKERLKEKFNGEIR
jgi:hypothetical protein